MEGDDVSPEEPFDPYRPPPPGSTPPPPSSYGPPPSNYGQPSSTSSRPVWLGALAGLILAGLALWGTFMVPDVGLWLLLALAVLVITLIVVPTTRRWGVGMLVGVVLSFPVGAIVLAGVCIALLVSYQGAA